MQPFVPILAQPLRSIHPTGSYSGATPRRSCCNREHHYIAVTPITKVASQLKLTNSAFPKTCME
jgi:hypothetical protein